ncbi:E set [Glarea lozoyensis ATCC 20868]|uniref:E set n=1 Tax=Glarea lozoyensis (strain ATCC 20868 / MF5171) TaxID=1116229 RepID=S3CKR6_GLAL2|nr:E set [Glarea lozoyensis ATCC 20868]EPE26335.1 E set [Glarea lozoyensis ATCC 20868]
MDMNELQVSEVSGSDSGFHHNQLHSTCCLFPCIPQCHCCCHDGQDDEHLPRLSLTGISPPLPDYMLDEYQQEQFLKLYPAKDCGPAIADFSPRSAYPGSLVVIIGHGFAPRREKNRVTIDGHRALVVTAERHRLVVISNSNSSTGPVNVKTSYGQASGPRNFVILAYPAPDAFFKDAPPWSFQGVGDGKSLPLRSKLLQNQRIAAEDAGTVSTLDLPPTGTARILAVCLYPKDRQPADLAAAKANIVSLGASVTQYYQQASYSKINVAVDVTDYGVMLDNFDWYYRASSTDPGYPNFKGEVLSQINAEAAQHAVNQNFNLESYDVLMIAVRMGTFVRAWGGGIAGPHFDFQNQARYPGTHIDITISKSLGQMILGDDATWDRFAHEFGHNIVSSPSSAILEEDIYGSDLPPGADASAAPFDLMGQHPQMPLFSVFHLNKLGWFNAQNVLTLQWNTQPTIVEKEIVAHGLTENSTSSRVHAIKIQVSTGLEYWIEVRQTPGTTGQIFDPQIPVQAGKDGGVVITRVTTGVQNNNQSMRLITLLQTNTNCLKTGDVAVDPARTLLITVLNDNVQARPLICKVRVEWAQPTQPTPNGTFDLSIEPWNTNNYTTPDIWVDRNPFNAYDRVDGVGNPVNGGDDPRVGEINKIRARIHNTGTQKANNVQVTFYSITPPGVGDNGTWTPLTTVPIAEIANNSAMITSADWVPSVGQHTCLQVIIGTQTGEILLGNNRAQENVFSFQPASHSVPEPVELPVTIRNPLNVRTLIFLNLENVPEGFYVYLPHQVVTVEPLGERNLELLVIPMKEIPDLKYKVANVGVSGWLPHGFEKEKAIGSVFRPIGGLQAVVAPKIGSQIRLQDPPKLVKPEVIEVVGSVTPATAEQKVRVDLSLEQEIILTASPLTDKNGRFKATFLLRSNDDESPSISRAANDLLFSSATPRQQIFNLVFQGHIVNASTLAPSDSNIVHFEHKVSIPDTPEGPK